MNLRCPTCHTSMERFANVATHYKKENAMQTLNYALAQVIQQERAQEFDVSSHIPRGARFPRNVRSLRTVIASLRRGVLRPR
jgi:hypothetical protein